VAGSNGDGPYIDYRDVSNARSRERGYLIRPGSEWFYEVSNRFLSA